MIISNQNFPHQLSALSDPKQITSSKQKISGHLYK